MMSAAKLAERPNWLSIILGRKEARPATTKPSKVSEMERATKVLFLRRLKEVLLKSLKVSKEVGPLVMIFSVTREGGTSFFSFSVSFPAKILGYKNIRYHASDIHFLDITSNNNYGIKTLLKTIILMTKISQSTMKLIFYELSYQLSLLQVENFDRI